MRKNWPMNQEVPLAAFQKAVLSHSTEATHQPHKLLSKEMEKYSQVLEAGFPVARNTLEHTDAGSLAGPEPTQQHCEHASSELAANTATMTQAQPHVHPLMPPAPPSSGSMPAPHSMSPTLHNLLMSWYWCGYYAGQHDAAQPAAASQASQ